MSDSSYPPPPPPPPPPPYMPPPASAYAHWGQRVGAYLLDVLILVPFYIVVLIGAGIGGAGGATVAVLGYLAVIGVAIWNLFFRQGTTGWSIGKRIVGIRLIGEATGQPLGPGMTFVRSIVHILDALPCYIGYLWPLWDAKRQTFADKIIKSVVVPAQEPTA